MNRIYKFVFTFLLFIIFNTASALTTISAWTGGNYPLGNKSKTTLEFLYNGEWTYGDNLFLFNVENPTRDTTGIEGVWASRLSASKITKKTIKIGPLSDMLLAGEYVATGENMREYSIGLGTNWTVPKFRNFIINAYWVYNQTVHGHTYQLEGVWVLPMNLSSRWHLLFSGSAEFYGPTKGTSISLKSNLLLEPSLLLDLGNAIHKSSNKFFIGLQYSYWHHMYGSDINESVPELKISWVI